MTAAAGTIAQAIDVIEETYEYMLAYAAQGRRDEDPGMRERLLRAEAALTLLASAQSDQLGAADGAGKAAEFLDVVRQDAARARAAVRFVLAQRTIASQMIDNLNASSHVRTLLTDVFLLDETLKLSAT
jgi:hypothetical protein